MVKVISFTWSHYEYKSVDFILKKKCVRWKASDSIEIVHSMCYSIQIHNIAKVNVILNIF